MLSRTCVLAGLLVVLLAASRPASQTSGTQAAEPFAAAVVIEDGMLVPFARFDGSTWERIWPEPAEKREAPATLQVPADWFPPTGAVPATWHLWLLEDPRAAVSPFEQRVARPVSVQKAERFAAHCLAQVGLRVDYRGPDDRQTPANTYPKRKAGIALTAPSIRIDPAVVLDPASPLAKIVFDRATQAYHRAEEDHLENFDRKDRASIPAFSVRRTVPVKWTKVLRHGTAQASERTYYLEGEVVYSPRSITSGHVWVQMSGDRETTDAEAVVTDEDRKMSTFRTPLGVVRVAERRFWVFEKGQWEHEAYEIVEASGDGQRPVSILEVAGGGC